MTDENDDEIPSMEDIAERISFTVSARATEANQDTHNRFKESAWERADGDYTEEIRTLYRIEDEFQRFLKQNKRFERLYNEIDDVREDVKSLEQLVMDEADEETENDEENDAF